MLIITAKRSVAASDNGNVPCPSSTGFMVAMAKLNAGQVVGGLADGDRPVLQAFEERALRLQRDTVDLVEQDDFGRRKRPELGHQLASRRIDHLEADDFGRLEIGASLDAREPGVADRRENHAEERLANAGHASQQKVAGVDLPLFVLVVGGRDFRQQHDVGEGLGGFVSDKRLAAFSNDGFVKGYGFFEVRMHREILSDGDISRRDRRHRGQVQLCALPGFWMAAREGGETHEKTGPSLDRPINGARPVTAAAPASARGAA